MNYRLWMLLLLLMLTAIISEAQPASSLTWLKIEVRRADDTLLTTSTFSHSLMLISGEKAKPRIPDGVLMNNDPGTLLITELTPGTHELTILLAEYGITIGPNVLEISKGPNLFTWKLPPFYPVGGELLLDGKPKATALKLHCQLMAQEGNGRPFHTAITDTPHGFQLAGIMPGKYNALIYCDEGYALTEFNIPADGKIEPLKPLPLLPGGRVVIQFVDNDNKPLAVATAIYLRRTLVPPRFTPGITVTADATGAAGTTLPPGEWRWSTAMVGYTPAVGTVNVVGGVDTELKIKLVKLPR